VCRRRQVVRAIPGVRKPADSRAGVHVRRYERGAGRGAGAHARLLSAAPPPPHAGSGSGVSGALAHARVARRAAQKRAVRCAWVGATHAACAKQLHAHNSHGTLVASALSLTAAVCTRVPHRCAERRSAGGAARVLWARALAVARHRPAGACCCRTHVQCSVPRLSAPFRVTLGAFDAPRPTASQVASRVGVLWGVVWVVPEVQTQQLRLGTLPLPGGDTAAPTLGVCSMVLAWSVSEIIRYTFYFCKARARREKRHAAGERSLAAAVSTHCAVCVCLCVCVCVATRRALTCARARARRRNAGLCRAWCCGCVTAASWCCTPQARHGTCHCPLAQSRAEACLPATRLQAWPASCRSSTWRCRTCARAACTPCACQTRSTLGLTPPTCGASPPWDTSLASPWCAPAASRSRSSGAALRRHLAPHARHVCLCVVTAVRLHAGAAEKGSAAAASEQGGQERVMRRAPGLAGKGKGGVAREEWRLRPCTCHTRSFASCGAAFISPYSLFPLCALRHRYPSQRQGHFGVEPLSCCDPAAAGGSEFRGR
jgi:hypothetical protein